MQFLDKVKSVRMVCVITSNWYSMIQGDNVVIWIQTLTTYIVDSVDFTIVQ